MKVCNFGRRNCKKKGLLKSEFLKFGSIRSMARRYKMTGCARILIVLIVITPIAFFVASYINNADPVEVVSGWFGKEKTSGALLDEEDSGSDEDLQEQMRRLQKELDFYKMENRNLEEQLKACQENSGQNKD